MPLMLHPSQDRIGIFMGLAGEVLLVAAVVCAVVAAEMEVVEVLAAVVVCVGTTLALAEAALVPPPEVGLPPPKGKDGWAGASSGLSSGCG